MEGPCGEKSQKDPPLPGGREVLPMKGEAENCKHRGAKISPEGWTEPRVVMEASTGCRQSCLPERALDDK